MESKKIIFLVVLFCLIIIPLASSEFPRLVGDGGGTTSTVNIVNGTDGNASSICDGTTTYLDGEGNCDDISGVYYDAADFVITDYYTSAQVETNISTLLGYLWYNATNFNITDYFTSLQTRTYINDNITTANNSMTAYVDSKTDSFANNYSDYLTVKAYSLNDSLWSLNYSDYLVVKQYALNDSLWSLNYSDYLTIKNYALNDSLWSLNYSDYLVIRDYALNASGITWAEAVNGTLFTQAEFDTNYSANDADYRSTANTTSQIAYNYATNGTYITTANEGNLDVNSSDHWDTESLGALNDTNTTMFNNTVGEFTIYSPWWQSFIAAYSTGVSWAEVINGTVTEDYYTAAQVETNISTLLSYDWYNETDFNITDYLTSSETIAYINANDTRNDLHTHNASNITSGSFGTGTYIFDNNNTMEGIILEKDTTNHRIFDNATCVVILGDTSRLEIC